MSNSISKALEWAIATAGDPAHGYDQASRLGPDYDCSSFVSASLRAGGFDVSAASTTRNLYSRLKRVGFVEVEGPPQAGDIYLTPDKHVVMAVSSSDIVHASLNEKGKTKGGKTGDQTGQEICIRSFYTPAYGWKYHLRYSVVDVNENPSDVLQPVAARKFDKGKYDGTYVTRESDYQNVRQKAGDTSVILFTILPGEKVRCYGFYTTDEKGRDWLLCQCDKGTGYLFSPLLKKG